MKKGSVVMRNSLRNTILGIFPRKLPLHDFEETRSLRHQLELVQERQRVAEKQVELLSKQQEEQGSLGRVLAAAEGGGAILTIAALVIYGAIRFSAGAFYARLGTTPEEVGLSYGAILGRAAASIVLLVMAVALIASIGVYVARKEFSLLIAVGLIPILFLGVLVLGALIPMPPATIDAAGLVLLVAVIISARLYARRTRKEKVRQQERRRKYKPTLPQVGSTALLVVIVFGLSGLYGYKSAEPVTEGKPLRCGCRYFPLIGSVSFPWISGSAGFLGIQAEPSTVKWVDGKVPDQAPTLPAENRAMFLGINGGTVVVYDPDRNLAIRLPIESVVVTSSPRPLGWFSG